jgi:hypothetical protein
MPTTVTVTAGTHPADVTTTPNEGEATVVRVEPGMSETFTASPDTVICVTELGATGQSGGGGHGIPPN